MSKRDELIELCRQEPEKLADLILALEARVSNLEQRHNKFFAYVSLFLGVLGFLMGFLLFIDPLPFAVAGLLSGLLAVIKSSYWKVAIIGIGLGIFNLLWLDDLFYLLFSGYV